ncbi:MAG: FmdB family zinc ribbon protein [Gammaproteobacteria bacterium]
MPIYEYRCEQCEHQFDALQKVSADPLTDCPECAKPALKKLVSAPSFRLKGGGWYETDFKKGNKRNLADDGKSSGGSAEGSAKKDAAPKKDAKKSSGDGGKAA